MDAKQIKQKSIEQLQKEEIQYIEHLPFLFNSDEVMMRTEQEIVKRLVAAILVTMMCFEARNGTESESMEWFLAMMKKFSLDKNDLTEKEKNIIYGEPTEQEIINGIWKYEAEWILFWVLGLVSEIGFPNNIASTDLMIGFLSSCNNLQDILDKAKIRDKEEILQMADLYYRYHWATTNYRLSGNENGSDLNNAIVMERRAGLWWTIFSHDAGISDWDNPDYNT